MGCDHAWAAGFVDGEGYLTLMPVQARKSDGYRLRKPKIEVAQTVKRPLLLLKKLYGGVIYDMPPRKGVQRKKYWRWDLTGAVPVKTALLVMLPYMRVKNSQAKILLRFIKLMNKGPGAARYGVSAANQTKRELLYTQLQNVRKAG